MRILFTDPRSGAFHYILNGMAAAFRSLGHKTARWDGKEASLRSFKPDLYIGSSGHPQVIPNWARDEFGTRVAYHVNPYGKERLKPVAGGPNINEPMQSLAWVTQQRPSFVFGYCYGGEINRYWDGWISELGIPVYGVPTAGDHLNFYKVDPDPKFKCDLAFVGGYWKYKAKNLDQYILPLFKKFNIKVYGSDWKLGGGLISDDDIRKLFSSSKIGPCVHEPHSAVYGIDIPERVFKVPLCGLLAISDPSPSLRDMFPGNILPMASTPAEYMDLIKHYLHNEEERIKMAEAQRRHILKRHTYLNRIQTILAGFGLIDESVGVQSAIDALEVSNG